MAKDPAVLFYIANWLTATKGMKADTRGWYLNLILYQFDKKELPNDIEELANLADVRISEFEKFKQVWEQVLKQKFKQNEKGNLYNEVAQEIIRRRELFKDKRKKSGEIGYIIKLLRNEFNVSEEEIELIKERIDVEKINIKNKQELKQMLEQMLKQVRKLYININNISLKEREQIFKKEVDTFKQQYPEKMLERFFDYWTEPNKGLTKMRFELEKTWDSSRRLITWKRNDEKFGSDTEQTSAKTPKRITFDDDDKF